MGKHANEMKAAMRRARENANKAFRDTMLDTFSRVVNDTPVLDGFLRANHQISVGSDVTTQIGGTQVQTSRVAIELSDFEFGDTVYFVNNLPYALRREFEGGISTPAGMFRNNLAGFSKRLQDAAQFYSRNP